MPWVYILQCRNGALYVGSTPNLEHRIAQHQAGEGGRWTATRLPIRLVFAQEMPTLENVFHAERQIKGWRRAKKRALIQGNYAALRELADTRSPNLVRPPSATSGAQAPSSS